VFFAWGVGAPFWQQSGPYGLPQKFAMVSSYWGGSDELQVLPQASVPTGAVMGGIPYYAINNPTNTAFVDAFRKAYGKPPLTPAYFEFVTLQALQLGIEKAKTTDTETVIKALEGLQFESVMGPVTVRPFDHQGTTPYLTGVATWDAQRKMGVLSDILVLPTEKYLPTEAEVKASRGQAN
jgi:branched-chain amino acid transport system substrate-binding protein